MEKENELSKLILDAAFEAHKLYGPGLLESIYTEALYILLLQKGLKVSKEQALPVYLREIKLGVGYRMDLVVEDSVIVEVKSVEAIHEIHVAQVLTYLKVSNIKLGLIINFNSILLKDGIRRVANRLYPISN
ncbi:MAG: GxxExxY protein [Chitinophagaceae bacterium]|nr:GxxExxY protein [Chitinophagaceae bacterium]